MLVVHVAAVVASLVVGWIAGLISFKKSEQFCAAHGVIKTCSVCNRRR